MDIKKEQRGNEQQVMIQVVDKRNTLHEDGENETDQAIYTILPDVFVSSTILSSHLGGGG